MRFTIEIEIDNDAFQPDWLPEVERILTNLNLQAVQVRSTPWLLRDVNGNTVGYARVTS